MKRWMQDLLNWREKMLVSGVEKGEWASLVIVRRKLVSSENTLGWKIYWNFRQFLNMKFCIYSPSGCLILLTK